MKENNIIKNEAQMNHSTTQPLNTSTSDGVAIRVDHVSKKFCRYLKKSMLYGMHDISRNLLGMSTKPDRLRKHEFWAVDDVSFELHRGETLGIIGPNGSGKSTILKMLNGIFMPDKGRIEINGRVGALIEVGAGFHPLLTGRENIYVNGAIMGMRKKEIDEKFDDIVEFADIGDFIDTPVKFYSSGMFVRLGFAVAVHCEPEILLVDEILSVGDVRFRSKSFKKMLDLKKETDKTIVFVSHDMWSVQSICDRVLWLNKGCIKMADSPTKVISAYFDVMLNDSSQSYVSESWLSDATGDILLDRVECLDGKGLPRETFAPLDRLRLRIYFTAKKTLESPLFLVNIQGESGSVIGAGMLMDGAKLGYIGTGQHILDLEFENLPLLPGTYYVMVYTKHDINSNAALPRILTRLTVDCSPEYLNLQSKYALIPMKTGKLRYFVPYRWFFRDKMVGGAFINKEK